MAQGLTVTRIEGFLMSRLQDLRPRHSMTARDVTTVTSTQTTSNLTYNSLLSTITGNLVNLDPLPVGTSAVTVPYTDQTLLTGSCTTPYFASYSSPALGFIEFPMIGCSERYESCCPVNYHLDVVFTQCPEGYSTVDAMSTSGCCPS